MTKSELAKDLRQRQFKFNREQRKLIAILSDEQIIDSYITCSCCGEKHLTNSELIQTINRAKSTEHFFELCDRISNLKSLTSLN